MDTSIARIPWANAAPSPLFSTPLNTRGEPVIFTVITDTQSLLEELKSRWIPDDESLEDPTAFAGLHPTLSASYQLLWVLRKTHYEDLNSILPEYDRYPVNILESLAFIRAYPEYSEVLEQGPYATASFHRWGEGKTPIALSIHPTEYGPPWDRKQMRAYWPTILGGTGELLPGKAILVRTAPLVAVRAIEEASRALIK